MLTVPFIRANREKVEVGLAKRGYREFGFLDDIIALDDQRKQTQTSMDAVLAEINQLSKAIGQMYKDGRQQEAQEAKEKVASLKEQTQVLQEKQRIQLVTLDEHLLGIPNVPCYLVPDGQSEEDNELYEAWRDVLPELHEGALPHWELAQKYGLIDFETGSKVSGSGFVMYTGQGAKLERALINFFLDEATAAGFMEVIPPLLVNEDTARATGQLPDKEGQMYYCEKDDLYLIPTAEVPITNIYRDRIVSEEDLPIRLAGYTPCFRREAGSYGADVKGLNRLHQFDKVEIVQIAHPDHSYDVLDQMVDHVRTLLDKLELPYRILRLCGGDLGYTSALTYDFEVYSAAQGRWLEVSSVSNFETYQSNRLKLRYKDAKGKKHLAHTLNGSALALARIVASLLENHQTPDGIRIPKVLVPYTRFESIT
ncbi:MAG: serine--tRNA ligase [Bacteroidota bacterium]